MINDFIITATKIFKNKYKYDNFLYIDSKTVGIITCPQHGEFKCTPTKHIRRTGGSFLGGCPTCNTIHNDNIKLKFFIEKANNKFKNKYDYTKFKYVNTSTKGSILCPTHGEFNQTSSHHLSSNGCPKCHSIITSYNKFIISKPYIQSQKPCTLYYIRLYNDKFEGYKIGITQNPLYKRIRSYYLDPSINVDVIFETTFNTTIEPRKLERYIVTKFTSNLHPQAKNIMNNGYTEVFKNDVLNGKSPIC